MLQNPEDLIYIYIYISFSLEISLADFKKTNKGDITKV